MLKHYITYLALSLILAQCNSLRNRKINNISETDTVEVKALLVPKDTIPPNKSVILSPATEIYLKCLLVIDSTEFYVGAHDGYLLHFKDDLCQLEQLNTNNNELVNIEQMYLDTSGVILVHAEGRIWEKKNNTLTLLDSGFNITAHKFIKDNNSNFYICNKKEIFKHTSTGWKKLLLPIRSHQYEHYETIGDMTFLAMMTEKLGRVRGATSEIHIFKDTSWYSYKSAPFYSVSQIFGNPEINDIYAVSWRLKTVPDTLNNSYFMQFVQPILYFNGEEWVDFKDDSYFVGDIIYVDYKKKQHFDIYKGDGDVYSYNKGQWDTIYIHKSPYTLSSRKKTAQKYGRKMLAISESKISVYKHNKWKVLFDLKSLYNQQAN